MVVTKEQKRFDVLHYLKRRPCLFRHTQRSSLPINYWYSLDKDVLSKPCELMGETVQSWLDLGYVILGIRMCVSDLLKLAQFWVCLNGFAKIRSPILGVSGTTQKGCSLNGTKERERGSLPLLLCLPSPLP